MINSVFLEISLIQKPFVSKMKVLKSFCPKYIVWSVLYFLLNHYNDSKGMLRDSMTTNRAGHDVPTASKVKDSVSRTDLTSNNGYAKALSEDRHLLAGLNVCKGKVTYKAVAKVFGKEFVEPLSAL